MSCETLLQRISAYIDSEVRPEEREEIEAHLATCERCARMAQEFRNLDDLAALEKAPPVRGEEWTQVLQGVFERASRIRASRRAPQGILESLRLRLASLDWPRAVAVAAVLLVSLIAARFAFLGSSAPQPRTAEKPRAEPRKDASGFEEPGAPRRTEDFAEQRAGPAPEIVVDPEDGTVHLIYRDF